MTISVVLRLTVPALREGRLAGQAEIVADGTRLVIRDAAELVDAVCRHLETAAPGRRDGGSRDQGMEDGPPPEP
jgi:hypothetical protein